MPYLCQTNEQIVIKRLHLFILLLFCLDIFWRVQNIPDSFGTVLIVQTVSKLSVYFRMTSKSSRWFHNCLDISRWSQNLPDGFITVRKFPDDNKTVPIFLEGLKTFWVFSIYFRMSSKSFRRFQNWSDISRRSQNYICWWFSVFEWQRWWWSTQSSCHFRLGFHS